LRELPRLRLTWAQEYSGGLSAPSEGLYGAGPGSSASPRSPRPGPAFRLSSACWRVGRRWQRRRSRWNV